MRTIAERIGELVGILSDTEDLLNEIDSLKKERDDYLAQLQLVWRSEKRPWFCPACRQTKRGYLQPFGQYGLRCADCLTIYEPKKEAA